MKKFVEKVLVIGFDAAIVPSVLRFVEEGHLPNLARLMREGTFAENCLVPLPTITPPNWTAISTGASLGTHGVTCYNLHDPGMPLDEIYFGWHTDGCRAEFYWDAAERVGKTTIVLDYPVSMPPTAKKSLFIGNYPESKGEGGGYQHLTIIAAGQLFATDMYPVATEISLDKAKGWKNVELQADDLEAELPLQYRWVSHRVGKIEPQTWHLLVQKGSEGVHDQVLISPTKDAANAFGSIHVGEWTENCYADFETSTGVRRAVFRFKLMELSENGRDVRIYLTKLNPVDGWSHPAELASEIESDFMPLAGVGFEAYSLGWIDMQTFVELCEMQNAWYADAATQIMAKHAWDAFFMHAHCPDLLYHLVLERGRWGKETTPDGAVTEREEEWIQYERALYASLDKMVGRIVEAAGENALVVIVNDHGAAPAHTEIHLPDLFIEKGLTVLKEDEETGQKTIDWSKTKAVFQRSVYIYVNLKGRDPDGIVEPEDYDRVREEIIRTLYDYTEPKTGRKPVAFALRKEDALILGLKGDRIGDVVYAIREGFGGERCIHGPVLPTAEYGMGSLRGLLLISGPGIKKGYRMERTAWLQDIVPTICYLTGTPVPEQTEGAVLYQAMEEPNAMLEELKKLRKNYQRLEDAYGRQRSLTHQYNQ